jgi:hypothetical protein
LKNEVCPTIKGDPLGNEDAFLSALDDEVRVVIIGGFSGASRVHKGRQLVTALFQRAREHYARNPLTRHQERSQSRGKHALVQSHYRAIVSGRPIEWRQTTILFFKDNSVILCVIVLDDWRAFDTYWDYARLIQSTTADGHSPYPTN